MSTHNPALRRKLEKLTQEKPDECKLHRINHEGQALEFIIPKKWIKITPPRKQSEAQRAAAILALQKARAALNPPAPAT